MGRDPSRSCRLLASGTFVALHADRALGPRRNQRIRSGIRPGPAASSTASPSVLISRLSIQPFYRADAPTPDVLAKVGISVSQYFGPLRKTRSGHGGHLLRDYEKLPQHQNVTNDRNDSVRANCPITRRPREHQYAEKRLQPVGPEKSSDAKNEIDLH